MNALILNASRHPLATLQIKEKCAVSLRDESLDTVVTLAKIWVKEGYRSRVLQLAQREEIPEGHRRAIIRAVVRTKHTTH